MNRFCIVLAVLFSINLTTSDFVSADDRAHRNGIEFYQEARQKLQEQERRSTAADDLFKQAIKSLEADLKEIKAPRSKAVVHLCLGISKYEYRRGSKKEAAESLKSALEGNWLNTEQRADTHFYLAMSLLALGEKKAARENFEKAFRQNPNIEFPSWREYDMEAVKEFNKVQKVVTGTLTITFSPREPKNWTISIDGKKLSEQNRNAVVSQDGLRLYQGEYNVQGIYKGESREETVTIEPNHRNGLVLEIPPLTVEHEPPSSRDTGQEIPLTIYVSRNKPRQVNVHYRKTSEWSFTLESPDAPPRRSADGWTYTYEVNLPSQDFVGEIEYYIEAEYADSPPVKHPENDYHQIPIVDNTPPTIKTVKTNPSKSAEVNQSIEIIAEVEDNISVEKVYVYYRFSRSSELEPSQYDQEDLTRIRSDRYAGYIPAQSQAGYIWYHIAATDEAGKRSESEKRWLEIVEPPDTTSPTIRLIEPHDGATFTDEARNDSEPEKRRLKIVASPKDKNYEPPPGDVQPTDGKGNEVRVPKTGTRGIPVTELGGRSRAEHRIWISGTLSDDVFKNGPSAFDLRRNDVLGFAYLREGKNCWTFGGQVDFPDWTNKVSNPILTVQFVGYSWEKFGLAGLGRGRISDKSTYSLGGSLKLYPWDRVTIDFTGSINLQSVRDARTNGASISDLLDTTHLDRYEIGIRFYYWRPVILRVGFGGWHLGRNTTGVQIGFGYTW